MSKTLLYVHGTGVREEGYRANFTLIEKQLLQYAPHLRVAPCRWYEEGGARLHLDGASIPTYGDSRGVGVSHAAKEQALWSTLLKDPSFELALLAEQGSGKPRPPTAAQSTQDLLDKFHALPRSERVRECVVAVGLQRAWPAVVDDIEQSAGFAAAKTSAMGGNPPHRLALARAVVAALERASFEGGGPMLDIVGRNSLTQAVALELGPDARSAFTMLLKPFIGLAESIGTWRVRRNRTSLSDATYPAAGDILVYQANGEGIRGFIADEIKKLPADDEVYIFAHSLGGIASLEMLVQSCPANVQGLITFGSQAPFFYEIGALRSLGFQDALPNHVPYWINFYDLNDPLSYVGSKVFPGRVSDYEVISGASFPASHGAYLNNSSMWLLIAAYIRDV